LFEREHLLKEIKNRKKSSKNAELLEDMTKNFNELKEKILFY
jgi:hypothetical protein